MNNPVISVVMPVYNAEKYLRDAIESILNQTITNFEFIIINDGSTDESECIILSFNDPRIVYVKNETNIKLIKTLNKGIEIARGKYIARMDSDDISSIDRFEKQLEIFELYNDVDIINISSYNINASNKECKPPSDLIVVNHEAIRFIIPLKNLIVHPGVMLKANLLKQYKYRDTYDTQHIEDYDLWNRMLISGCVCYTVKDKLLYYRISSNSINRTYRNEQIKNVFNLSKKTLELEYNYKFSDIVLLNILGDYKECNVRTLKTIKKELDLFFISIAKNYTVSVSCKNDLLFWKKYKMLTIMSSFFRKASFKEKVYIAIFSVYNVLYFNDKRILYKLLEIASKPIC